MTRKTEMNDETKTSFVEGLAARAKANPKRREHLAIFLALRFNVIEAMDAGYALKTIWEHMHETGRVPFRYETFLRHVRRYITNASSEHSNTVATTKPTALKATILEASSEPKRNVAPLVRRFNFDPVPKKEELF